MAILKSAALANSNQNYAIADSNNLHGGWKNHLENIGKFTGLQDNYTDVSNTGLDWTGGDAWGLYKPWSTLVYVEDARPLVLVSDTTGLTEGTHYFDVSLDGSGVYYGPQDGPAQPGIFIYFGNEDSPDGGWNVEYVKTFTLAIIDDGDGGTIDQASLSYWKNINEIVTDPTLTQGLTDLVIDDNVVDVPANLSELVLTSGGVTGNAEDGYVVNLTTGQDVLDAIHSNENLFSNGGTNIIAKSTTVGGEPRIEFDINNGSVFTAKSITVGTILSGGVNDPNDNFAGNLNTYGEVTIHKGTDLTSGSQYGALTVNAPATLTDGVSFSAGDITALAIHNNTDNDTENVVVIDPTTYQLGKRALNDIAFNGLTNVTYVDDVDENHLGGVDDDLITVTDNVNTKVINIQASPTLASSGSGVGAAALQLGPDAVIQNTDSGADDTRLVVRGSAEIVGDLNVQGSITTTSSEDVTFEDAHLTLNFARESDGSPAVDTAPTTGSAGIEAWYGYDTVNNENQDEYSRPYIRYEYDSGYGKWYLANSFDSANGYTANAGYILTSLDVGVIDSSVVSSAAASDLKYHDYDAANDTTSNLTTPYGLLTPYTLTNTYNGDTANVVRKFGRVATVQYDITTQDQQITNMQHKLNTSAIYVVAIVVTSGSGNLPPVGSVIHPKYKANGVNGFDAKILGSNVGDTIKFVIMG